MGEPRTLTMRHGRFTRARLTAVVAVLCLTWAAMALQPVLSSAATGTGSCGGRVAEDGRTAHISRTEYGIPHIRRAQLGLRMIAERLAGTDGLGAPGFTPRTLRESMSGNRVLSAETGRDDVVDLCTARPRLTATDGQDVDVRNACTALARWDTRADTDSRGAALWNTFFDHLLGAGPPDTWHRVPYDPAEPLTTPRGIKGDDIRVQRALADAVQDFAARDLPVDTELGALQKWAGIPVPGCNDNMGCFNVLEAGPDAGTGTPAAGAFGSTFLMAAELTPDGPRTHTLMTYGQSTNPASPHHTDQTRLFSRGQWVTERFTAAEIASDPALEVTVLRD